MNIFKIKAEKIKLMYLPDLYEAAIENNNEKILDLNREQLDIGLLADGNTLPYYLKPSVNVFGKRPGRIRLYDTGDFWKGFYIDSGADAFDIKSNDWKNEMLIKKYSEDIFGLVPNQKKEMALIIKSDLVNLIKQYL